MNRVTNFLLLLAAGAACVLAGAALGLRQNAIPPPPRAVAVESGLLAAEPEACAGGALYVATDEPVGQQLNVCKDGAWYPYLSVGDSGALAWQDGVLDIVPSVVPRKTAENTWLGRNTFADFRLAASTASCVDAQNDLGRLALDTSDPQNTRLRWCGRRNGQLQWLPLAGNAWSGAQ
jgi:hypothetical protein